MKYLIERESRTRFDVPVREHHVQLRVAPWEYEWQRLVSCSLSVEPDVEAASHRDGFGNRVHRFGVMRQHQELDTRLHAEVETLLVNPFDFEAIKDKPYNVGLDSANLSKLELCAKIREHVKDFVCLEAPIGSDPDRRPAAGSR